MKLYMVTAWAVENKARCLFCLGVAVRPSQAGAAADPGHPSRQGTPVAGQGCGRWDAQGWINGPLFGKQS